jgi:hypothetical protein
MDAPPHANDFRELQPPVLFQAFHVTSHTYHKPPKPRHRVLKITYSSLSVKIRKFNNSIIMASASNEQDLLPEQTEGFKVGEKKTMAEYDKLGM